jgi:RNA-binding motif protein, X-linked 2
MTIFVSHQYEPNPRYTGAQQARDREWCVSSISKPDARLHSCTCPQCTEVWPPAHNNRSPEASWHTDYRDTAFINFGGLPYELTEGDIITIFSQYGEPVFLKLARDKETGKSKGFGWLKYEDQRSCDLAVDNFTGAVIAGRLVRVDHARYKPRDDEDLDEFAVGWADIVRKEKASGGGALNTDKEYEEEEEEAWRPRIKEEIEFQKLIEDYDDDDPMKGFLIEEKKREVEEALRKARSRYDKDKTHHRRRRSHHHSRRDEIEDGRHRDGQRERSRRDKMSVMDDTEGAGRDKTPEGKRDRSKERDREGIRRDDYNERRDKEHRRDREDRDRDYGDQGATERRRRRYEDGDRRRDRKEMGGHRSRRRSRTRSPP